MQSEKAGTVLLVEDTETLSMVYSQTLKRAEYSVTQAFDMQQARMSLAQAKPSLVLLDLLLPDGDGLDLLEEIGGVYPDVRVIVVTANGSIYRAVRAMRAGAFDFLVKPFDDSKLLTAVQNALSSSHPAPPDVAADGDSGFEGFIGTSDAMREIYRMIRSIGRSTATVFITGESGTGKEVCARAIHANSTRSAKAFVPLNCAAIPRDLLESEVFGHLKGAFTGALSDKPGAAAIADGGTLFLDEICEMDLSLQTKLLRFLQTSTIQPVGSARPRPVDVRIVCATNRDPLEEVKAGRFREDLYYRLHVVPIQMPPLRGRDNDILEIAKVNLEAFAGEEKKSFKGFSKDVERILMRHPWPGNVRQLLNVIRNIVVLHEGDLVTPAMLPTELVLAIAPRAHDVLQGIGEETTVGAGRRSELSGPEASIQALVGLSLAHVERRLVEATIEKSNGSVPKASKILGLSPSTVYRKLENWAEKDQV